jgi:hypothetical protein
MQNLLALSALAKRNRALLLHTLVPAFVASIASLTVGGCASVSTPDQRTVAMSEERFTDTYRTAVYALWLQPRYAEAAGLVTPNQLSAVEERLRLALRTLLPGSPEVWVVAPYENRAFLDTSQSATFIRESLARAHEQKFNSVLVVTLRPAVSFPGSAAQAPYVVRRQDGSIADREFSFNGIGGFAIMRSVPEDKLLFRSAEVWEGCWTNPVRLSAVPQLTSACIDKVAQGLVNNLQNAAAQRTRSK